MLSKFFRKRAQRRREKLCSGPFPAEWLACLERRVGYYARLADAEKARLRDAVRIFVAEKSWEGCGGLEMTDEIRVTVAAQACLLTLGFEDFYFDDVRTVLVYPSTFVREIDGVASDAVGEAIDDSTVVLSWDDASLPQASGEESLNVVFHEFAHMLDDSPERGDGTPPIPDAEHRERWESVLGREHERLIEDELEGRRSVVSFYGVESRGEFFAVATEAFFQHPVELRRQRPALYTILAEFYRQQPAGGVEPCSRPTVGDEDTEVSEEDLRREVEEWGAVLDAHPRHLDARIGRGFARADLGDLEGAREDLEAAIELDESSLEALVELAEVLAELGEIGDAVGIYDRVLLLDPEDTESRQARARLRDLEAGGGDRME